MSGTCQARDLLRCLPCLACLWSQCTIAVLPLRSATVFCLGAAGCGLLTAASSAFASAGVRGRHSPRLESVSAGAQATGAVVRRCGESDAERHSPRLEIEGRQVYRLQSPRLEGRRLEGVGGPMQEDTRRGWKSKEGKCTGCSRQG